MHTSVLILGGGITGLSTAYHLEKAGCTDYLLAEKEPAFGGLCASIRKDGFTLDYGGHLLHLHTREGETLVRELLGDNLLRHKRNARVFFKGKTIPFPFQANLWALPPDVRDACVRGLVQAAAQPKDDADFEQWCLSRFGRGIYEAFMRPYNEKLWGCSPKNLTAEWCPSFVPVPAPEQIQASAQHPPDTDFGYNAYFYYPAKGGIGALCDALAARVTHKRAGAQAQQIDLSHHSARINGQEISYDTLINTLPLPAFMRLVKDAPEMQSVAQHLRARAVSVCHIALRRETEPVSWIYFADRDIPFYRVGLQSGFSPNNAPAGTSLFYVEFGGIVPPEKRTRAYVCGALERAGLAAAGDEVLLCCWQELPYAYALYDGRRTQSVDTLKRFLAGHHCYTAGRYGGWEYSFMEYNLTQGARLAQKLI